MSSKKDESNEIKLLFHSRVWNVAHIYEENQKIVLRNFYKTKNLTTFRTFDSNERENLSEILFPNKVSNVEGFIFNIGFIEFQEEFKYKGRVESKWTTLIEILISKVNGTLKFHQYFNDEESIQGYEKDEIEGKIDFHLNGYFYNGIFNSYTNSEFCFMVPLPRSYTVYEMILFLPFEKSCWISLGLTVIASAFIWRIFEGPGSQWRLFFGVFALFVGQFVKIRS